MGQQWHFEQDEQSQWRWTHQVEHEEPIVSATSFASQTTCMIDAVRYIVERSRAQAEDGGSGAALQTH